MMTTNQNLSYGRLGLRQYDLQASRWLFCRQLRPTGSGIYPISFLEQTVHSKSFKSEIEEADHGHCNDSKPPFLALLRDLVEFAPGAHLLPQLEQISEALQKSDTAIAGSLAAIGSISDRLRRARLGVFVTAGGPAARYLRFDVFERFSFQLNRVTQQDMFVSYKIRNAAPSWYDCGGDPVLQVAFSDGEIDWGSIMAIRHQNRIAILQPFASQHASWHPNKQDSSFQCLSSFSRIDPGRTANISPWRIGSSNLAHVAFNPWEDTEVAVIDTAGLLSIWKLMPDKNEFSPTELTEPLFTFRLGSDIREESDHDGWGRVLWVHDRTTLIVARRRNLALLQMKQPRAKTPVAWTSRLPWEKSDWILQIDRCPMHSSFAILLTKQNLLFLKVGKTSGPTLDKKLSPTGEIILSCPHNQSTEDNRLNFASTADGTVVIIALYREDSEVIIIFSFAWDVQMEFIRPLSNAYTIKPSSWMRRSIDISEESLDSTKLTVRTLSFVPAVKANASNPHNFSQSRGGKHGHTRMVIFTPNSDAFEIMLALGEEAGHDTLIDSKPSRSRSRSLLSSSRAQESFVVADTEQVDGSLLLKSQSATNWQQNALRMHERNKEQIRHIPSCLLVHGSETYLLHSEKDSIATSDLFSVGSSIQVSVSNDYFYTMNEVLQKSGAVAEAMNVSFVTFRFGDHLISANPRIPQTSALTIAVDSELLPFTGLNSLILQITNVENAAVLYEKLAATCIWPLAELVPSHTRISIHALLRKVSLQNFLSTTGAIAFQDEWRYHQTCERLVGTGPYQIQPRQDKNDTVTEEPTASLNVLQNHTTSSDHYPLAVGASINRTELHSVLPLMSCLGVLEDADVFSVLDTMHEDWNDDMISFEDSGSSASRASQDYSTRRNKMTHANLDTSSRLRSEYSGWRSSQKVQDTSKILASNTVKSPLDNSTQHLSRMTIHSSQPAQSQPNRMTSSGMSYTDILSTQSQSMSQAPPSSQKLSKRRKAGFR